MLSFPKTQQWMQSMEYRKLGAAGLKVSELSFGSWVTFNKQVDAGLAERIVFLGDLDRETVRSCYRRLLLCVAASRTEGFGLTPLEAMACGRAVLVSGAGVWPQLVDPQVGASFQTGSVDSLVMALRDLLRDPQLLWQMGINGRQRSLQCHSLQGEATQINQLYGRLMDWGSDL